LPRPVAERRGERWTYDVACDVLRTRGGLAAHPVRPEGVCYFGWPGQALSYKLGERARLAAWPEARRRLGTRLGRRRRHDQAAAPAWGEHVVGYGTGYGNSARANRQSSSGSRPPNAVAAPNSPSATRRASATKPYRARPATHSAVSCGQTEPRW